MYLKLPYSFLFTFSKNCLLISKIKGEKHFPYMQDRNSAAISLWAALVRMSSGNVRSTSSLYL